MGRTAHASKAGKHKKVQVKVVVDIIEHKTRRQKRRARPSMSRRGRVREDVAGVTVEEVAGERAADVMVPRSADAQMAKPSKGNVLTSLFTRVSWLFRAAFAKTLPAEDEMASCTSPVPGHGSGPHAAPLLPQPTQQRQDSKIGLDRIFQLDFLTLRGGYVLYVSASNMPGLEDQLGLFALQDIPGNILLGYYTGPVIDGQELERRVQSYTAARLASYTFALGRVLFVDATERGSAMRFINHSKIVDTVNGPIVGIFSKKAGIRADAEVTYNYNLMGDEAQKEVCHCGTPTCRGTF